MQQRLVARLVVGLLSVACLSAGPPARAQVAEYRWVAGSESIVTWAAGDVEATFAEPTDVYAGEFHSAIRFDGREQQAVVADLASLRAPKQQLTLEAWAIVDRASEWGGLVGAIQDNGAFERGYLLGFRDRSACLAIAAADGERLTYLTSPEPLTLGDWVHLVGTYDGKTMRLYVNGEPVAESDAQSGDVATPPTGVAALGAYRDDDENFPLQGMLHEAAIVYRVYSPIEAAQRYAAKRNRLPPPPTAASSTGDLVHGPFIEAIEGEDAWQFTWRMASAADSRLLVGKTAGSLAAWEPEVDGPWRRVRVAGLPRDGEYVVRIEAKTPGGREIATPLQNWDALLDYSAAPTISQESPFANSVTPRIEALCRAAVAEAVGDRGYALVLDGDAALAWEIAAQTHLQVVIVDDDPGRIQSTRAAPNGARRWRSWRGASASPACWPSWAASRSAGSRSRRGTSWPGSTPRGRRPGWTRRRSG